LGPVNFCRPFFLDRDFAEIHQQTRRTGPSVAATPQLTPATLGVSGRRDARNPLIRGRSNNQSAALGAKLGDERHVEAWLASSQPSTRSANFDTKRGSISSELMRLF
jgi:hypothetical protein